MSSLIDNLAIVILNEGRVPIKLDDMPHMTKLVMSRKSAYVDASLLNRKIHPLICANGP